MRWFLLRSKYTIDSHNERLFGNKLAIERFIANCTKFSMRKKGNFSTATKEKEERERQEEKR